MLGDLSGGGPGGRNSFARILEYEAEYGRSIAQAFPVITLCQYDARKISAELGPEFSLLEEVSEVHRTPSGTAQAFSYFHFRREPMGNASRHRET